ncbi:hypothetical protein G6514_004426 [Epicoccum nigrum]|nr:hypothetical protein G6514_004426 [Epicoccum nigrum]
MKITLAATVAALAATTAADFVVVTALPTPTDLGVLLNFASYTSSLAAYVTGELASFTAAASPSALSEKARIQKALASFAATATQYSIPSGVTALTGLETFTTVPTWYSALPSEVKSYYDKEGKVVESILFKAVGVSQNGTGAASAATGSPTKSAAGAGQTGAAGRVGVVGAGVAAAFLGVVAL